MERKAVYWPHARRRMRQRGITEAEVEHVLAHPEVEYPGNVPGRRVYVAHPNGRYVKVVFVVGTDPIEIVTVAD